MLFPEEAQPGVDLILPDFDYLRDRLDDVVALVLTHGHEDHIGPSRSCYASDPTSRFMAPNSRWRSLRRSCASDGEAPLQVVRRVTRNGWVLSGSSSWR